MNNTYDKITVLYIIRYVRTCKVLYKRSRDVYIGAVTSVMFFYFIQIERNYLGKILLTMHVHTCALRTIGRYISQHLN